MTEDTHTLQGKVCHFWATRLHSYCKSWCSTVLFG